LTEEGSEEVQRIIGVQPQGAFKKKIDAVI